MNNRFNLLFYFKKSKSSNNKSMPIYMRITVDCNRTELSTQRTWDPERWNVDANRAKGIKEDARSLNDYLDTLQLRVQEAQRQLIANNEEVTVQNLRMKLEGKRVKSRFLVDVFKSHNQKLALLINKDFAEGTHERYETALRHTVSFLEWKYKKSDVDIQDLDYEFVSEMEFWLKSVRRCSHNTTMKYISNLKKIVNICLKNNWLDKDPFIGFKTTRREVIREVLTPDEIMKITEKKFVIRRLEIVRDIFVFSCYTGLAYTDVKKLRHEEIAKGIDGEQWIFTQRRKTETPVRIPILPKALEILEKYRDHPACVTKGVLLPVPSNQKLNAYLTEIAEICGIHKKMTSHTARHTFATTITLSNGVPIETVSRMLGHTSIKTTQQYAKILDKKVSNDMSVLRAKLV